MPSLSAFAVVTLNSPIIKAFLVGDKRSRAEAFDS